MERSLYAPISNYTRSLGLKRRTPTRLTRGCSRTVEKATSRCNAPSARHRHVHAYTLAHDRPHVHRVSWRPQVDGAPTRCTDAMLMCDVTRVCLHPVHVTVPRGASPDLSIHRRRVARKHCSGTVTSKRAYCVDALEALLEAMQAAQQAAHKTRAMSADGCTCVRQRLALRCRHRPSKHAYNSDDDDTNLVQHMASTSTWGRRRR